MAGANPQISIKTLNVNELTNPQASRRKIFGLETKSSFSLFLGNPSKLQR